ncbi:MAG: hypothetical protein RLY85_1653, partial [Bacteroidota bacterium]
MKINAILFCLSCYIFFATHNIQAQSSASYSGKDWHLADLKENGVYGISLEKAYQELLKGKTPKKKV